MNAETLPLGIQSFLALRDNQQIYVDKTAMISQLANRRGKFFLARPRRFGKSLLVSALASLFKHGVCDFQGLAIEKLWSDKTYDVVHLDLSTISNFRTVDEFRERFYSMLSVNLKGIGFASSPTSPAYFISQLVMWLRERPTNSLVLLIDEYDSPLTTSLNDKPLFLGVQQVLSEFFNTLKSCDSAFRYLFITGVTRFCNTGIFSGFNSLIDITLDPEYGTLLGYTEEELKHYFPDFLQDAAKVHDVTIPELLQQLRGYYDGFSFDSEGSTHVYCPWSVLKFFDDRQHKFNNYWFQSAGQPTVLLNYLVNRKLDKPMDFLETISMDPNNLLSSALYDKLDVNVLLQQMGYLTIRSVDVVGDLQLGYPNREVTASMACLYAKIMTGDEDFSAKGIMKLMMAGEVQEAIDCINKVLNSMNYNKYPIRDEASFQCCMQILLIGASLLPRVEVHSARGRSDMEVDAGDYRWVFEFKFARKGDDPQALCQAASDQILKRKYGETAHEKQLIRIAMVFEEEARQVTAWKAL